MYTRILYDLRAQGPLILDTQSGPVGNQPERRTWRPAAQLAVGALDPNESTLLPLTLLQIRPKEWHAKYLQFLNVMRDIYRRERLNGSTAT